MSHLICGYDSMEFGWLVSTWVPAMRFQSQKFDRTTVVCNKNNRYFYSDFATDFVNYSKTGKKDRWLIKNKLPYVPKEILKKIGEGKYYVPSKEKCLKWERKYRKYGTKTESLHYDFIIHARDINNGDWIDKKLSGLTRNWPKESFEKLIKHFEGMKICSIGTNALHIDGTEDKRKIPLEELCNIMASSNMIVGTSSGPMHLASMCGCQQVVFSDRRDQRYVGGPNRKRYKETWNPFGTPVKVMDEDNWNPPVKKVIKVMEKRL